MGDTIYRYHHPIPSHKNTEPLPNDGFRSAPLWLLWIARSEWRDSGRMPGRKELTRRLERAWTDDVYLLDEMIERAKPQSESSDPYMPLQD